MVTRFRTSLLLFGGILLATPIYAATANDQLAYWSNVGQSSREESHVYQHHDGREIELFKDPKTRQWRAYVVAGAQSHPLENGTYELLNGQLFPFDPYDDLTFSDSQMIVVQEGSITEWRVQAEVQPWEYSY